RQGADRHPVLDAIGPELDALVGVLHLRVVGAQLLDDPAVARLARVDGHDAEVLAVLPPHHLHADSDCHFRPPGIRDSGLGIRNQATLIPNPESLIPYRFFFFLRSLARSLGLLRWPVPIFCLGNMPPGEKALTLPSPVIILMRSR